MIVMGFVMVFEWNALSLDNRDYQILNPLPLGLPLILAAKLAALGLFPGLFLVDINLFVTPLWPGIDTHPNVLGVLGAHITG
jgi:hypothetical protein